MIRPLIAIMTCWKPPYVEKANAQRATWVQAVRQFADVKFFRGHRPHGTPQEPDVIELDVDDSYRGLPRKVRAMASWAYYAGYKRMMKCDDDVFIVPQRFQQIRLANTTNTLAGSVARAAVFRPTIQVGLHTGLVQKQCVV